MYARALKWPIISWVVIDLVFLVAFFIYPSQIGTMGAPGNLTVLLLAVGAWAGYKIVEFGGNYLHAAIAGLIVGAVCAVLDVIGFGVIAAGLTGGITPDLLAGALYFLGMNFFGSLIGGGFALTK
ncbi:MAG: hypothetical protein L0287_04590 [Anaerolineae bacterium]|nr:hypothetical protein [Anaerolineae bacterium]MCI0610171.1 hypothetical protein [Anaerolineae bacterium]